MKKTILTAILFSAAASAQTGDPMLAKIRTEGIEHSQVSPVFDMLTVNIGPRLTASPAHKRAAEWARDRLASYGLADARLEPWKFGRGWTLEKLSLEMVEPRYLPLLGYADGWSASTSGELVGAPAFIGDRTSPQQLTTLAPQLKGAIVMTQPILTNFVRKDRPQPSDPGYVPMSAAYATSAGRGRGPAPVGETTQQRNQRVTAAMKAAGAAVILKPSVGEHGTVFVTGRDEGPGAVPSVTLSAEHYN
ncbi:MAG: hypothetical protein ACRD2I_20380, partial [Vicinamibacterales bacterium]